MPTLSGITRDSASAPIANASVIAYNSADNTIAASGTSNALGDYSLTVAGAGPFYVVAYLAGPPFRAGTSRRDLTAVADVVIPPAQNPATVQSLWTGTPTQDGAVISAKLNSTGTAAQTRIAVSTSAALSNPIYSSIVAPDTNYRVAKHTVTGRLPNTEYWYAVEVDGVIDTASKGRFKTLPAAGAASFSIVLGGCAENTSDAAFSAINALNPKPLLMLAIGDFQYMDIASPTAANYHAAFDTSLARAVRKITHSQIPTVYMWDDHDFADNDSSGFDSANAAKSFRATALDFFRGRVPVVTASSTAGDAAYYSFVVGRVRFVVSDLRSSKTAKGATDNGSKSMMGAAQKTWWKAEITAAKNAGQIVAWVNSVPWVVMATAGADDWGGYTTERTELSDHIKAEGMSGKACILSADMHALAIHSGADYATGGGALIPVFHAGPFNRQSSHKGGPYTYGPYPASGVAATQYGVMDVADDGTSLTIAWKGYSSDGTLRMSHSFTPIGASAPATAPAKMTAPNASAGNGQATVTLVAPNDGGSPITGYTVTSNPSGGVDQQAGTTSLTRAITGLTNAVSYTFTATATNAVGTSLASDPSNPVMPVAPSAGGSTFEATGGTIAEPGDGYRYWEFLSDGTLNVTQSGEIEYLVVGGGGPGGRSATSAAGGGGAGEVKQGTLTLPTGTQAITVGAGGPSITGSNTPTNGASSRIGSLVTAIGGGFGGFSSTVAGNGGNGGGAGSSTSATAPGTSTTGTGHSGGTAIGSSTTSQRMGGGGGGAGGPGANAMASAAGNGGPGVTIWGRTLAGGGGGTGQNGVHGSGMAGGGNGTTSDSGMAGAANTGSGGGAIVTSVTGAPSGAGGSGLVVIRKKL